MSRNQQIYVDYDDVLCETARAFQALVEKHFNRSVEFDEITSFDLGVSFGLSSEELDRLMHLAHEPDVLLNLEPIAGATEALNQFIAMGCEIAVITGRPPSTGEASKRWLETNHIPHHRLLFVDKYGRAGLDAFHRHAMTLAELEEMSFRFAVEDASEMALYLSQKMDLPVALFDRPWNRDFPAIGAKSSGSIDRCADWAQVLDVFVTL